MQWEYLATHTEYKLIMIAPYWERADSLRVGGDIIGGLLRVFRWFVSDVAKSIQFYICDPIHLNASSVVVHFLSDLEKKDFVELLTPLLLYGIHM